jgi:hypothetical protein
LEKQPSKKTFEHRLVKRLWHRIHDQNLNAIIGIYGPPGSGKSYTALRIAELIDPKFTVDNVVFTVQAFNQAINSGQPRGTAIIGDDFGVAANARKWQSDPNMILSYIAQTFRWKGYCTIITLPDIDILDAQVRRMVHLSLQTISKNEGHQAVICEPRVPRRYMTSKTTYWYYPTTTFQDKDYPPGTPIKRVAFHHPDKALCDAYEKRKQPIMDGLYQQWETEGLPANRQDPRLAILIRRLRAMGMTATAIAKEMGVRRATVHEILRRSPPKAPQSTDTGPA